MNPNVTMLRGALVRFIERFAHGVNEDRIAAFADTLPNQMQNAESYCDALFELVRAGVLTWRSPKRMPRGEDELSVALVYQRASR